MVENRKERHVVIIANYFGRLSNNFQLWLDTCATNGWIDWCFITDASMEKYDVPKNVKIIKSSFTELKAAIQKKFNFPIRYSTPWQFCLYRPVFPLLFSELIDEYEYWGWCDCDVLFGDLSILRSRMGRFDKILPMGHLSIVRRDMDFFDRVMQHPMIVQAYSESQPALTCFDEIGYPNTVLKDVGATMVDDIPFMQPDVHWGHYKTCATHALWRELGVTSRAHTPCVFSWCDGDLVGHFAMQDGCVKRVKLAYMHFFRRPLSCDTVARLGGGISYMIIPNEIVAYDGHAIQWDEIVKLDRMRINWKFVRDRMNVKWFCYKTAQVATKAAARLLKH